MKHSGECKVEDCDREVVALGWCRRHYQRQYLKGDPGPAGLVRLPDGAQCTVERCDQPNVARGYCEMHRWRVRSKGDPGPAGQLRPRRKKAEPAPDCSVERCDRPRLGKTYCKLHYDRVRKTGEPGPAEPLYQARGNGHITKQGYRRIHVGNGRRVLEHVHVMEQLLGRRLVDGENVHHVNGIRHDNRTDGPLRDFRSGNLELWLLTQPSGQRVQDLMEYIAEHHADAMREILATRP